MTQLAPKVSLEHMQGTKDRILHSAEALFAKKGYYDTSMDDLVKKSGFSKGAIYGHFDSKEDIFLALQERSLAVSIESLESKFSEKDTALEKLKKLIDFVFSAYRSKDKAVVERVKENCKISLEFLVAAPRIETIRRRLESSDETTHRFTAEIIKEGVRKGEFKKNIDVDSVTTVLWACLSGLTLGLGHKERQPDWLRIQKTLSSLLGYALPEMDGKRRQS